MGLKIKIMAFIVGIIFFVFVLAKIKKNSLRPSYAFLWLLMSVFLLSISILEPFYKWFAVNVIGIDDARHIIYMVIIVFLLTYVFYLTLQINKMNDRLRQLISFTAILEKEIKDKNEK